jgi:hypothetical protein
LQRGSLKRFYDKRKRIKVWRFQWREPGFNGPRTRELGRCADVSRAEARMQADRILLQVQKVNAAIRRDSVMTVSAFIYETYLEVKSRKWKASTQATTEQIIRDHIVRKIGPARSHEITRSQLQALLDQLAATGLSQSVVAHVHFQLSAVFAIAIGDGLITINPTSGLQTPRCKQAGEKPVLLPTEFCPCATLSRDPRTLDSDASGFGRALSWRKCRSAAGRHL